MPTKHLHNVQHILKIHIVEFNPWENRNSFILLRLQSKSKFI